MNTIDLVIFDCDGVLVDSEIISARVESELLTAAGYEISAEELAEHYAGLTFKDILLRIEQKTTIPLQASLLGQSAALFERRIANELKAIEGVHEAVAGLNQPHCVCSNSSGQRLDEMLTMTRIKPLFEGRIFSSLETPTKKPKPAPDVFLHAASVMKADPAKTFVIEDSIFGIAGAKAAGMRVIGFTGGSHTYPGHSDALTEAGAETVIRRWAELKGVIEALAEWSDA